MGVNKVVYDGDTLIDLTGDSVTPNTLVKGATAHNAAGERITGTATSNFYGVCSTASDDVAKTVEIDGFQLVEGAQVTIKFTNANSVASPTLNVSGTGAYPMMRYGTTAISTATTTSGWSAGAMQTFTFDGEAWVRDYWYNTTYSNVSLGQGYATCSTAAATVAKVASLSSYSLTTGGIVAVRFTYDVPANATLNINSKGAKAIYHRNAAIKDGVIQAGDIATFVYSTYYRLIAIDRDSALKPTYTTITLPAGRMYGDLDGDGRFSVYESNEMMKPLVSNTNNIFTDGVDDELQIALRDVTREGTFNIKDAKTVMQFVVGTSRPGLSGSDYTGNWTANPNYETEDGQFYTDVTVSGITTSSCVTLIAPKSTVTDVQCFDGYVRVFVALVPIEAVTATLIISPDGGGNLAIDPMWFYMLRKHEADQKNPHNVTASQIEGTFGSSVKANATSSATLSTSQLRNIKISTTDLTAGTSSLATGDLYFVYS